MSARLRVAIAALATLLASACGGGSPEPPATIPAVPGATQVTGRERLAWDYDGDGTRFAYRAYVDDVAVALESTTCVVDGLESRCSSPLPAMRDGVHSVSLAAVDAVSGQEGERSATLTLQKVTVRTARTVSTFPDAGTGPRAGPATVSTAADAVVIARDVLMPAQLAPLPGGRLLVAEANGRVRVFHPEAPHQTAVALESAALLDPPVTGPLAIAVSPDFVATRHAFVSDLYSDGHGRMRMRVVRVREVGDRLGEPATIFDTAVIRDRPSRGAPPGLRGRSTDSPRLAFGDDGLLYGALPSGLVFDSHPAASEPVAALVRLTEEGRTPAEGPLSGVTSHPMGFTWHPATGRFLGLIGDSSATASLRAVGSPDSAAQPIESGLGRVRVEDDGEAPILRFDALARPGLDAAHIAALAGAGLLPRTMRLAVPADLEGLVAGVAGRLEDVVTQDGVLYALASDAPTRQSGGRADGMILRIRR